LHSADARQLDEVAVVDAGEREQVRPLGVQLPDDAVVAHERSSILMCKSLRSCIGTGAGAPSYSARAAVVLGNAMTSRNDCAPESCIAIRSKPKATPPCGGAPARSPSRRKPNRALAVASSMPSSLNT